MTNSRMSNDELGNRPSFVILSFVIFTFGAAARLAALAEVSLGSRDLQCFGATFTGANPDGLFQRGNEDLAVADLACLSHFDDGGDDRLYLAVFNSDFDLHLRN